MSTTTTIENNDVEKNHIQSLKCDLIKIISRKKATDDTHTETARLSAIKLIMDDMNDELELIKLLSFHKSNLYRKCQRDNYNKAKSTAYTCPCGSTLSNSLSKYNHLKSSKKHQKWLQSQSIHPSNEEPV